MRLHGIQPAYYDIEGTRRTASPEAIVAILQALGVPLHDFSDVRDTLRLAIMGQWRRRLPRVAVAWKGQGVSLPLKLPRVDAEGRARCHLALEDGSTRQWNVDMSYLPVQEEAVIDGIDHVMLRLDLADEVLPAGYHRLILDIEGIEHETSLISAPNRVYRSVEASKTWGLFAPVYALRSDSNWGAGDLSDLRRLMELGETLGAGTTAILPLLSTFLDEAGLFAPSPYTPVSRLFWNEMYVDATKVPELEQSREARDLIETEDFRASLARRREEEWIDHAGVMSLKRQVLQCLSRSLLASDGDRKRAYEAFLKEHPYVHEYAGFRATCERHSLSWMGWPEAEREGRLQSRDLQSSSADYHRYVQWVMHEQLEDLAAQARRAGEGLYLDLPVGVHSDGYDCWRWRDSFALAASAGAPPDPFFTKGQSWGFPPLSPEGSREQAHRYFIDTIRNHLSYAGILRVDHVMSLHRLFWIPDGFEPAEGVYVRYPADELYAILCLESHKARARIVGENLGTVPDYVNEEMDRRGLQRMYVGQFSISSDPDEGLLPPQPGSLACLNTHDMPTFAAFWQGDDIDMRIKMGLLDKETAASELAFRKQQREAVRAWLLERGYGKLATSESDQDVFEVLAGLLKALAESDAQNLLVNLEDLWVETRPQNVPGTTDEYPNWRRRMSTKMDEVFGMAHVLRLLRNIDRRRRRREK